MRAGNYMRWLVTVAVLTVAAWVLIWAPSARGDGGFISPYHHDIWEPEQKALILYDQDAQTEDLIIQASFYGDTRDFGWIIPVPSVPELDTGAGELFFECSRLTQPLHRRRGNRWGCDRDDYPVTVPGDQLGGDENDFVIVDEQTIGIYQALTISAQEATALTDSLTDWGFLHEDNQDEVTAALQFYIDKSWYFVALKMDSTVNWEPDHNDGYWYGGIEPVRLTFSSPQLVYPMRISAISTNYLSQVLLYVCSNHRTTFTGAATEYANRISDTERLSIRSSYPILGEFLPAPCYLTKLRRTFRREEMTDDIAIERAPTDAEYREIIYTGLPITEGILMAMAWLLIARPWRRRTTSQRP